MSIPVEEYSHIMGAIARVMAYDVQRKAQRNALTKFILDHAQCESEQDSLDLHFSCATVSDVELAKMANDIIRKEE